MIIAGNFKTHHTRSSTLKFCTSLDERLAERGLSDVEVRVFPPLACLPYDDFSHFRIGAQNAYGVKNGAFSGEVGAEQLLELGVKSLLIGHSERRERFKEDFKMIKEKFDFFSSMGFEIFFCIGEDRGVRESGKTKEFLLKELEGIDLSYSKLVVAYEPIWAIGSGKSAESDEIEEVHCFLRERGVETSVYGGSVKSENAKAIMSLEGVDGVLVGGASVELESFCAIIGC